MVVEREFPAYVDTEDFATSGDERQEIVVGNPVHDWTEILHDMDLDTEGVKIRGGFVAERESNDDTEDFPACLDQLTDDVAHGFTHEHSVFSDHDTPQYLFHRIVIKTLLALQRSQSLFHL